MYLNDKLLSGHLALQGVVQTVSWILFARSERNELKQCATLMANVITGSSDQPEQANRTPVFGDAEDFAYLLGFYVIESLQHKPASRHWLLYCFKRALADHSFSNLEIQTEVAQFQAFYWHRMQSLTWGAARLLSRRNMQKLLPSIYRLRKMTGQPALFF